MEFHLSSQLTVFLLNNLFICLLSLQMCLIYLHILLFNKFYISLNLSPFLCNMILALMTYFDYSLLLVLSSLKTTSFLPDILFLHSDKQWSIVLLKLEATLSLRGNPEKPIFVLKHSFTLSLF